MRLQICKVLTVLSAMLVSEQSVAVGEEIQLIDGVQLVFASRSQGQELVREEDTFIEKMQDLERQIRLESKETVTKSEYLDYLANCVEEWTAKDRLVIEESAKRLRNKMEKFNLPFPKKIYLVRVASNVEANAPHCRGASIILPDGFFESGQVDTVLTHELFHVLSSHNRELRDKMYSIIGFTRCGEIKLPASLIDRRLTNPDAPTHEHYISLKIAGRSGKYIPVTFTKTGTYQGGNLFQNLDFQLMELEASENSIKPKINDGQPVLVSPRDAPDFMRQIGRNTGYIIHPEETLADNFWMMVLESSAIRDRWVTEKLSELLKK